MKEAIMKEAIMKEDIIEPNLRSSKRGRKPKFSEVEFIIPETIQYGLVVMTPPLKKHTRRPPLSIF